MWLFGPPTSEELCLSAQDKLLKYYIHSPYEVKKTASLNYVIVKGAAEANETQNVGREEKVLVLMHGYGLGLGFFYENIDELATHFNRVIAVDWPGMGCSSRATKFTQSSSCGCAADREKQVAQTVTDELIDALEKLRIDENIPHFTLAGHSLGGYLSGKYALKYPSAVENLVLISPVGIPLHPPAEHRIRTGDISWKLGLLERLWRWNYTPQAIVRIMGSRGPKMVKDHINRRFGNRWDGEPLDLISDYMYHITAAPASGEYTLNALLEPIFQTADPEAVEVVVQNTAAVTGATVDTPAGETKPATRRAQQNPSRTRGGVFAKLPLDEELCALKVPILLVYGDNDWLSYPTAAESVRKWQDAGVPAAKLEIIANAGHHLYLDNSADFNRAVIQWVQKTAHLA